MTTIERAVSAQDLYWIKNATADRIGIVWRVEDFWHWTVGAKRADAISYDEAVHAVEAALGETLAQPRRRARARRAA